MPTAQENKAQKMRRDNPGSWIAVAPGDFVAGELVDVTDAWSDQRNGFYPLLTVKVSQSNVPDFYAPGTETKVHAFRSVLWNEIERKRPQIGEHLIITYLGQSPKEPAKGMNPPELYRVTVPGQDAAARTYNRVFKESSRPESDLPFGED